MQKQRFLKFSLTIFYFLNLLTLAASVKAQTYTPPGYTPPSYTPEGGYTPPGYTPPGVTPAPGANPGFYSGPLWEKMGEIPDIWDLFGWGGNALLGTLADIFSAIVNLVSGILFGSILKPILNVINNDPNILLNLDITQKIWGGSLIIANALFLLALIIASIAIILRLNTGM